MISKTLTLSLFLLFLIFSSGCVQTGKTKIGDILANPRAYEGKTVIIEGKYGGWSGDLPCNYSTIAMKTRSDKLIYDDTGCLYMTGNVELLEKESDVVLSPVNKSVIGTRIKVKGVIKLIDGKPILD